MLGTELERRWGPKKFFKFYAICAVGGAVLHTLIWIGTLVAGSAGAGSMGFVPIVGASGALYGLFVAFGMLYANAPVLVFFVLPMKARQFVIILVVIEIVSAVFYSGSGVAHLVHLGGMAAGYLMLKFWGPNLNGGSGGGFFRKRQSMSREEVRQRLRVISNDPKDGKGDKGMPITWN
jgi:membrane associated rhomboid family serine protease